MKFDPTDKVKEEVAAVKHESAGGFIFFEDKVTHRLYVTLLKSANGKYFIPKGHLKKDEKPLEAAVREIKEELSLKMNPAPIAKIGVDNYTFTLPGDIRKHIKSVHLYVFFVESKAPIKPTEGFISAEWLFFYDALKRITFDRENLLRARQVYYFNKPVSNFNSIEGIKSITIGVPTYNGELTINNTLYSIRLALLALPKQIKKEIVICLDHCTDNTRKTINNFVKDSDKDVSIKGITNRYKRGKSSTLNSIFEASNSQIFCTVDDDVTLEKRCIAELIGDLIGKNKDLRYVYARWNKNAFRGRGTWEKFWHYILGIKFDLQPYDRPSEFMRGSCMLSRRESYVWLPQGLINEDQFLQYIYWPKTKEVKSAVVNFNSVNNLLDYYKRFIRISAGVEQFKEEFSTKRFLRCTKRLYRKIDYKKIIRLPLKQKLAFLFYRSIRYWINRAVKYRLSINQNYEWSRYKQG